MKAMGFVLTLTLLLCSVVNADWYTAKKRGLFPYFENGGNSMTIMVFVNSSEETADTLYIRFMVAHESVPPGWSTFQVGPGEMFVASTSPTVPVWLPIVSSFGYVKWRAEEGDSMRAICMIYSSWTGSGYNVPSYDQDDGF